MLYKWASAEVRAKRRARLDALRSAAERDEPEAQTALAWEYARGDIIDADIAQAWRWFERAAASGREDAVLSHARFLQLRGVPEGLRTLRRLAMEGNWKAQHWMGDHHAGRSGRMNQLRALAWYKRSGVSGNQGARPLELRQQARVAPFGKGILFRCMLLGSGIAAVSRMSRHPEDLEDYETLLYRLKRSE